MTRKITQRATTAFFAGKNYTENNTAVNVYMGGLVELSLHGNIIAFYNKHGDHTIQFNLCGWNTLTTRERLAGLGIKITVKKGIPYYNGQPIESRKVYRSDIIA